MEARTNIEERFSRIVVAGTHGSAGKTTTSIGLVRVLKNQGRDVRTFKKGPDFIDPMWLTRASGRVCRNLDFMLMGEAGITASFAAYARGGDINIIEGNKGLFDGVDTEGSNSTSALARLLSAPVLLVVDCAKMTRGIAPLLIGYENFEPDLRFAGIILNNVAGSRHEGKVRDAVERYTDMRILGAIPRDSTLAIKERHLGLTPDAEEDSAEELVERCARLVREGVDVDGVLSTARNVEPFSAIAPVPVPVASSARDKRDAVRIACARDRAFSFYYPESLEALEAAGADLVFFSPLTDRLPACDGVYLGGGFPELYANQIAANSGFLSDLREHADAGGVIYAECGGLMILGQTLNVDGLSYEMAGILPFHADMYDRPQGRGYMGLKTAAAKGTWDIPGDIFLYAHEFHHSRIRLAVDSVGFAYSVTRGVGVGGGFDGILERGVLASYAHLHPASAPWWADAFVGAVLRSGLKGRARIYERLAV